MGLKMEQITTLNQVRAEEIYAKIKQNTLEIVEERNQDQEMIERQLTNISGVISQKQIYINEIREKLSSMPHQENGRGVYRRGDRDTQRWDLSGVRV